MNSALHTGQRYVSSLITEVAGKRVRRPVGRGVVWTLTRSFHGTLQLISSLICLDTRSERLTQIVYVMHSGPVYPDDSGQGLAMACCHIQHEVAETMESFRALVLALLGLHH